MDIATFVGRRKIATEGLGKRADELFPGLELPERSWRVVFQVWDLLFGNGVPDEDIAKTTHALVAGLVAAERTP